MARYNPPRMRRRMRRPMMQMPGEEEERKFERQADGTIKRSIKRKRLPFQQSREGREGPPGAENFPQTRFPFPGLGLGRPINRGRGRGRQPAPQPGYQIPEPIGPGGNILPAGSLGGQTPPITPPRGNEPIIPRSPVIPVDEFLAQLRALRGRGFEQNPGAQTRWGILSDYIRGQSERSLTQDFLDRLLGEARQDPGERHTPFRDILRSLDLSGNAPPIPAAGENQLLPDPTATLPPPPIAGENQLPLPPTPPPAGNEPLPTLPPVAGNRPPSTLPPVAGGNEPPPVGNQPPIAGENQPPPGTPPGTPPPAAEPPWSLPEGEWLPENPQLPQHPLGAYTDSQFEAERALMERDMRMQYHDLLRQLGYRSAGGDVVRGELDVQADRDRAELSRLTGLAGLAARRRAADAGNLFSGYFAEDLAQSERPYVTSLADLERELPRGQAELRRQALGLLSGYQLDLARLVADAAARRAAMIGEPVGFGLGG